MLVMTAREFIVSGFMIQSTRAEDVDVSVEYAQNRLRVAEVFFKHCVLYVSLNFMQS